MKHPFLITLTALTLASLACGLPSINLPDVPRLTTIPTETLTVNEAAPDVAVADVTLSMGAGTLELTGGGDGLVSGEIRYNVAEWKPTITSADGAVTIEQNAGDNGFAIPPSGSEIVNEWALKLGDVPMDLTINAGAYKGTLDLSGVPLQNLSISDGASSASVTFDSLNPEEMDKLRYDSGASSVTLSGLANANAHDIIFKGGAGDYTLDFTGGELQRDTAVDITAGVSSVKLIVPEGMNVTVKVNGAISDVNTHGTWTASGSTYTTSGSGFTLTVNVDMGVGSLTLTSK